MSISTTDNVDAVAGVGDSFQPSSDLNSGVVGVSAVCTVTPGGASTAVHKAPSKEVARFLFIKETINPANIPSKHICPLSQEQPFVGVHFDVPDANGIITEQVYEQSLLYGFIATPGTMNAHLNVIHPLNQASVPRTFAWNLVCPAKLIGSWDRRSMAMAGEVTRHGQAHPYSWLITIVSLRSKESEE
jgi:hypothetical protein